MISWARGIPTTLCIRMPDEFTLHVRGYRELSRAFSKADAQLSRDLRSSLKAAAEPVRSDAELLARARIRRIRTAGTRLDWARMRVGVTSTVTYVAPRERGVKARGRSRLRRPKFAGLLLSRSMEPALERNAPRVAAEVEHLLDVIGSDWER